MINHIDVVQLPGTIEKWLGWAIEPEVSKPSLVRQGLDPVLFLSSRCLRTEVKVDRAVGVFRDVVARGAMGGTPAVDEGPSFIVIDGEGSELRHRHVRGHVQVIGLTAVKPSTGVVLM